MPSSPYAVPVKAKVALDAHKGLKTVGELAKQHHRAAKALGRTVRNFDDKTWKANTRRFVTEGNVEKFKQNPEMLEFLLGTGDAILVEAAPRDQIWGIGLAQDNPKALDPSTW